LARLAGGGPLIPPQQPANQDALDLIEADLVVAAAAELGGAGRALMGLLRLRSGRGLRRLLAPLADAAGLALLWRRSHKLLARSGQLRLHVGQLLPGGLQLATHLGQISVPRGEILGQLGQFLLRLRPLLLNLPHLNPALLEVRGQGRQGLLSLGSLLSQLLYLVARRRKLLLQRRLRFARLLDALLGLRGIRGFVCRFLGYAGQLLARLALLLARGLQPLADVSQLLGARDHGLLIVRDLVTRCRTLLFCLLHLPLNLGQLLGLGLELLDDLRLLLALCLKLLLNRDQFGLRLVPGGSRLARLVRCGGDPGLQIGQGPRGLLLLG